MAGTMAERQCLPPASRPGRCNLAGTMPTCWTLLPVCVKGYARECTCHEGIALASWCSSQHCACICIQIRG